MKFEKTQPCANCPYRTDAPLAHWSIEEFQKVMESDKAELGLGGIFECHKRDGHICRGFLMDQVANDIPNNSLRLTLLKQRIPQSYLDSLHCSAELYDSLYDMCEANYPGMTDPD